MIRFAGTSLHCAAHMRSTNSCGNTKMDFSHTRMCMCMSAFCRYIRTSSNVLRAISARCATERLLREHQYKFQRTSGFLISTLSQCMGTTGPLQSTLLYGLRTTRPLRFLTGPCRIQCNPWRTVCWSQDIRLHTTSRAAKEGKPASIGLCLQFYCLSPHHNSCG